MSEYNHKLLDHFLNPRNVGTIENPDGYARVENPVNGYTTDIYVQVNDGYICDIKSKTLGCTVTIASTSALTNLVKGRKLQEFLDDKESLLSLIEEVDLELGKVPEKNWHCLPTSVQAFFTAIYDYYQKNKFEENINKMKINLEKIDNYFKNKLNQLEN